MITIYKYNDTTYEDTEDQYTPEEIQTHWGGLFPEVQTATYTVIQPAKEGEPRQVIFAKKVGTKGVSPQDVLTALGSLQEKELFPLAIYQQLESLNHQQLLAAGPEIEKAYNESWRLANESERITNRCLKLKAIPSPRQPAGF